MKTKLVSLALACTLSLAPCGVYAKEKVKKLPTYHTCDRSDSSKMVLACNIYKEARGEGLKGMMAVGMVTLNRLDHDKFPTSIRGVVYQKKQFSWTTYKHGLKVHDKESWDKAVSVAEFLITLKKLPVAYNVFDFTGGSLYYHSCQVKPYWIAHFVRTVAVGNHVFYKLKES